MQYHSDNMIRHLSVMVIPLISLLMIAGCGPGGQPGKDANAAQLSKNTDAPPLLRKWCSDCHAPPSPETHQAQEWLNVVARMQMHRSTQGLAPINKQDMDDIVTYLRAHAKP